MSGIASPQTNELDEDLVKTAIAGLDWYALKRHFDAIGLTRDQLIQVCGYIRRCTDLIYKYPRKTLETRRTLLFDQLRADASARFGTEAESEVAAEIDLLALVEYGYRAILGVLEKCPISQRLPAVRSAASVSRAGYEYLDLMQRVHAAIAASRELNCLYALRLQDDEGNSFSADAILESLVETVAMTLIMEAYKNSWFEPETDIVILPEVPAVGEKERFQAGATQVTAACWRQWQRVEKRRRYTGGELRVRTGADRPHYLPPHLETVIEYHPPEDGSSAREVYDKLAHVWLEDRFAQTFLQMEIERGVAASSVGIAGGAPLLPCQYVSAEEAHAAVSLSEIVGYSIAYDAERPEGLRLLEWVRGYAVLQEIAKTRTNKSNRCGDDFAFVLTESELISQLQVCGLEGNLAACFVALTSLHKSSRDMFDCPLVRLAGSRYLLFGPAAIHLNIALVILSNLSNRGAQLSHKGKAFEHSVQEFLRKQDLEVFAFEVKRDGEFYEYDAIVPWNGHLFVFECKNRTLPGNDPVLGYYFNLETASEVRQTRRLADALARYPDIIEQQMGPQYLGHQIVPCVLHSLPYARIGATDGVYFTNVSALKQFFQHRHFRIKSAHRIGPATLLHRVAIKQLWSGNRPTAVDFLAQLEHPFQLELSLKHLEIRPFDFGISETEHVVTHELVRTEMDTRSICDALGANPEAALNAMTAVAEGAAAIRANLEHRPARDRRS